MHIFAWGDRPQYLVGVELGGRVWYRVRVLRIPIRHNLFAGTETIISLRLRVNCHTGL